MTKMANYVQGNHVVRQWDTAIFNGTMTSKTYKQYDLYHGSRDIVTYWYLGPSQI